MKGTAIIAFPDKGGYNKWKNTADILNDKGFDGRGNYTMGISEQLIFPEIDYDKVDRVRGMDITFVTTAKDDESARAFLDAFGFPFSK